MKLKDLDDYGFTPNVADLTKYFSVEEKVAPNGSVEYFFNLNEGVTIDGADELNPTEYSTYVCKDGENLRFVAYRIYGSVHYWWLIAKLNGIYDAFEEIAAGRKLKLLSKEYMNYILKLIAEKRVDA